MASLEHSHTNQSQSTIASLQYELRQLMLLGLPIMGSQVAQMGMGIMDAVMSGRLSAEDLAGISLGGSVLWPTLIIFWGLLMAITPSVSQMNGSGKIREAGTLIRQGLWVGLFSSLIVILIIINGGFVMNWLKADPAIVEISVPYLQAIAWGIPGLFFYFVLRYMAEGMGHTKPALIIAVCALCLNLPLNYIFMYGEFGLPALGSVGCGWASAIVMWFECLAMLVVATAPKFRTTGWLSTFEWPKLQPIRKLVALGLPIGITGFLEFGAFSLAGLLLGRLGAEVVASHQIVISTGGVTFMLPLALGHAASIRIGFSVGAGLLQQAKRTAQAAIASTLVVAAVMALIILGFREGIASLYTTDVAVAAVASKLLLFVVVYQVFDNAQATAIGALRGYKSTKFPVLASFVSYWVVALPIGFYLTYGFGAYQGYGVYGLWGGLTLGLVIVSILVTSRLFWLSGQSERILVLSKN